MTEDMNSPNDERPELVPPPRRRRTRWVFLLILIVAATGAGLYFYNKKWSSGAAAAADGTNSAQPENTKPSRPAADNTANPPAGAGSPIGQIYIAPERQQLIGVKTASAEMKSLLNEIRTVGRVAYDETKITHIHTKVSG